MGARAWGVTSRTQSGGVLQEGIASGLSTMEAQSGGVVTGVTKQGEPEEQGELLDTLYGILT